MRDVPVTDRPDVLPDDPDLGPPAVGWPGPRAFGLVLVGGFFGTLTRAGLSEALSPGGYGPLVILVINLLGAFLLGLLLETLAIPGGTETLRRRRVRLLLGTGFLGGFTTYSTFAVDVVQAGAQGLALVALVLAVVTVLGGLATAALGIGLGTVLRGRTQQAR